MTSVGDPLAVEATLLSAGMRYPIELQSVAHTHGLSQESFTYPFHRHLYAVLVSLVEGGVVPVDDSDPMAERYFIVVRAALTQVGVHSLEGSFYDELERLRYLENVPFGIDNYARSLAEFAERRRRARELIADARRLVPWEDVDGTPAVRLPTRTVIPAYVCKGVRVARSTV